MKRLGRGLSSWTFKFCLFLTAVTAAFALTFGRPGPLKESLAESGLYDQVVAGTIEQIKKGNDEQQTQGEAQETHIPLDDAAIERIAKQVFPVSLLQKSAEQIIDGIYHWLSGQTEQPDFRVDLSNVKQNLAQAIADEGVRRTEPLPVCTPAQLAQIDLSTINLYELPCLPPGFNLPAERQRVVDEVASSQDFLKEPVITADNLKNDEGETPFRTLSNAPRVFQWSNKLPWMLGSLAVVSAAALIWLHDDRRRAIFVLGRALLLIGLVLLVGTLIMSFIFSHAQPEVDSPKLQAALVVFIRSLGSAFNAKMMIFAIIYIALGGGSLLGLYFTRPREDQDDKEHTHPEGQLKPEVKLLAESKGAKTRPK